MSEPILREARRLADEVFRPHAEEADQGDITGQVGRNVRLLADAGYFGLGIAPEFGGMGADDATRREYTELMASACGVTAFVQQQLHAGGGFVGGGRSEGLKREKLPLFASGTELCGVGFSHLRRPGPPMVRAERVPGGFRVSGTAPWVTGWSLLDSFILGAALPDDAHLFAYIPKAGNESTLTAGPRIPLVVMNASDTVEVTMTDLFVPEKHALSERPAEALKRGDFCGISGHVYLPLGGARGSVHYLRQLADHRGQDESRRTADEFQHEIDACRREALAWGGALRRPAGLQAARPARPGDRHRAGRPRRPRRRRRHRRQRAPPGQPSSTTSPRGHLLHNHGPDRRCARRHAGFAHFPGMLASGVMSCESHRHKNHCFGSAQRAKTFGKCPKTYRTGLVRRY